MIPTIPTVSKTVGPNTNQSPSCGEDIGDKSAKMLKESAPSKQAPTRTKTKKTIPKMADDKQSTVDFFNFDLPKTSLMD